MTISFRNCLRKAKAKAKTKTKAKAKAKAKATATARATANTGVSPLRREKRAPPVEMTGFLEASLVW